MMKKLLCFLMLLWPLFAMAQTRWSDQTARCFIDRYSNPQDIHWLYGKNSFSWQAGYVMFALEKGYDIQRLNELLFDCGEKTFE